MTDPGHLARRAQLAVLLDRADRLTVDEASLLRTLVVAELATTPARITGDPMPQPQTADTDHTCPDGEPCPPHDTPAEDDSLDEMTITDDPTDPEQVLVHLPVFGYLDTQAWSVDVGIPRSHLRHLAGLATGTVTTPAQPDTTPQAGPPEFVEVGSYRTDAGHTAWAMRCWGAGTCDGLISLDHDTERWAVVARDRHLSEAHNVTTPQAGQPQADGPLVLDRAAAIVMRDFLNQLLGDEPADAAEEASL